MTRSGEREQPDDILVLPRNMIAHPWYGLDEDKLKKFQQPELLAQLKFKPRLDLVENSSLKKVMPLLVYEHEGRYLVVEDQAEQLTLGVRGYILRRHVMVGDEVSGDMHCLIRRVFNDLLEPPLLDHITEIALGNDDAHRENSDKLLYLCRYIYGVDRVRLKADFARFYFMSEEELKEQAERMDLFSLMAFYKVIGREFNFRPKMVRREKL